MRAVFSVGEISLRDTKASVGVTGLAAGGATVAGIEGARREAACEVRDAVLAPACPRWRHGWMPRG